MGLSSGALVAAYGAQNGFSGEDDRHSNASSTGGDGFYSPAGSVHGGDHYGGHHGSHARPVPQPHNGSWHRGWPGGKQARNEHWRIACVFMHELAEHAEQGDRSSPFTAFEHYLLPVAQQAMPLPAQQCLQAAPRCYLTPRCRHRPAPATTRGWAPPADTTAGTAGTAGMAGTTAAITAATTTIMLHVARWMAATGRSSMAAALPAHPASALHLNTSSTA